METETVKVDYKEKFKINKADQNSIERLIASESEKARQKLYEAYASPFGGRIRIYELTFTLNVQ
jgi:hypothetical protein